MKIASWNVNSVKARLPNLTRWLEETAPDIACLQELKCVDASFPREDIEALGYNVETHGQKTYNWSGAFVEISAGRCVPRSARI